jgi:OOP family OmpA-OmpF porin
MKYPYRTLLASVVLASLGISTGAVGQGIQTDAYWLDSRGYVAKNGFGECWRTSQWTPAKAIAECDPDLVAKPAPTKAVVVATPAPTPAPVVVAAPASVVSFTLGADASFDTARADLKEAGRAALEKHAPNLKGAQIESIVVIGHTDDVGAAQMNQQLSERRAEAVKAYLVSRGVAANKIQTSGRGESDPIADNKTAEGRAKNRRVHVEVKGTRTVQ